MYRRYTETGIETQLEQNYWRSQVITLLFYFNMYRIFQIKGFNDILGSSLPHRPHTGNLRTLGAQETELSSRPAWNRLLPLDLCMCVCVCLHTPMCMCVEWSHVTWSDKAFSNWLTAPPICAEPSLEGFAGQGSQRDSIFMLLPLPLAAWTRFDLEAFSLKTMKTSVHRIERSYKNSQGRKAVNSPPNCKTYEPD